MAVSGVAVTVEYLAWDTDAQAYKTGDAANHTLRVVADGAEATPSGTPAEVDATNAPGVYKLALTEAENTGTAMVLAGKSATANVIIVPVSWHNTDVSVGSRGTSTYAGGAVASVTAGVTATAASVQAGLTAQGYTAARARSLDEPGTTWYVDPTGGSDTTGDGSIAAPVKTVGHAQSLATGGDIVRIVTPGGTGTVYCDPADEKLVVTKRLNIIGPGRHFIWRCQDTGTWPRTNHITLTLSAIGCCLSNLTLTGPQPYGMVLKIMADLCHVSDVWIDGGDGGIWTIGAGKAIIENVDIRNGIHNPITLSGTGGNVVRNCTLVGNASTVPEDFGLKVWDDGGTIIENCTIRDFVGIGLLLESIGVVVRNCAVYNNTGGDIVEWGAGSLVQNNEQWSTLTAQGARDAMKLAPSSGAAAAGSIDDQLADIAAVIAALSPGTGAHAITLTVKNPSGTAIEGVTVALQASGGINVQTSDASGHVVFNRDAGTWAYAIADHAAYAGATGSVVVASDGSVTSPASGILTITPIALPTPASADNYVVYGTERSLDGASLAAAGEVVVKIIDAADEALFTSADGELHRLIGTEYQTDASGQWSFEIAKSCVATKGQITIERVWIDADGDAPKEVCWAQMDDSVATVDDQIAFAEWGPRKRRV